MSFSVSTGILCTFIQICTSIQVGTPGVRDIVSLSLMYCVILAFCLLFPSTLLIVFDIHYLHEGSFHTPPCIEFFLPKNSIKKTSHHPTKTNEMGERLELCWFECIESHKAIGVRRIWYLLISITHTSLMIELFLMAWISYVNNIVISIWSLGLKLNLYEEENYCDFLILDLLDTKGIFVQYNFGALLRVNICSTVLPIR